MSNQVYILAQVTDYGVTTSSNQFMVQNERLKIERPLRVFADVEEAYKACQKLNKRDQPHFQYLIYHLNLEGEICPEERCVESLEEDVQPTKE